MWQESRELTKKIYKLTSPQLFKKDLGLKDQVQRASVSVMTNIAEGFERESNNEFIKFLTYSKGLCGEVRSLLYVALDLDYINQAEFDENYCKSISIIAQTSKFKHIYSQV
ncbi:MAG: four helix bundle protein [Ignavibacteriaceae bacterium]|nr:four helix bundle protein [Ignavibacteriaceae bacterium]